MLLVEEEIETQRSGQKKRIDDDFKDQQAKNPRMTGQKYLVPAAGQHGQIRYKDAVQGEKGRDRQTNGRQDQPSSNAIQVIPVLKGRSEERRVGIPRSCRR